MGVIYRDGVAYGGISSIAGNVSYDNSTSHLQSSTVQNAITELKSIIDSKEYTSIAFVNSLPAAANAQYNTLYIVDSNNDSVFELWVIKTTLGQKAWVAVGDNSKIAALQESVAALQTEISGLSYIASASIDNATGNLVLTDSANNTVTLQLDGTPTANSKKPITSGAVYTALDDQVGKKEYVNNELKGEIFNTYSGLSKNTASGLSSHAEGSSTNASGLGSHAEGVMTQATGDKSHAEGNANYAAGDNSHAEGSSNSANGLSSHAEGYGTTATGDYSHTEGSGSKVYSEGGHAEGDSTTVGSAVVDPETSETTYTGTGAQYAHAEGKSSVAAGIVSHAEGYGTIASGQMSHAEGRNNTVSGYASHVEGEENTVSGRASHAEGVTNTASGYCSHAEGYNTSASDSSHAEGEYNTASGRASHVEGARNTASGNYSHASGLYTIANSKASTVIGKYNVADGTNVGDPKHLFIVGNGTGVDDRSNIIEVSETYLNVNGDIKQNGVTITSTPHTELTQAQYDALQSPDTNTEYFITDASSGVVLSDLESRLAALEMQETVYYIDGVQRVPLYSQNITQVVKIDDNTVDWYFLEPTSQKTYKARVTAQGEGNTRTNPLIVVTEVNS